MSATLIQIHDDDFKAIIKDAFKQGAEIARKQLEREQPSDDIIKEDEALAILGCSKSKLDKLRSERAIKFYTTSRPYSYSRSSIEEYMSI